MNTMSTALLVGLAAAGFSGAAFAQGAGTNSALALPELQRGVAGAQAAPALNVPVRPSQLSAPLSSGDRQGTEGAPQGGMAAAPAGPGSGLTFAFQVPSELSTGFSTAAIGKDQPVAPGSFSTASGSEPEAGVDGVPPMLGVDLSTGRGNAALAGRPALAPVTLGR